MKYLKLSNDKGYTRNGFWLRQDGSEGGMIEITNGIVEDFDGALDLPLYVKKELIENNIEVNF